MFIVVIIIIIIIVIAQTYFKKCMDSSSVCERCETLHVFKGIFNNVSNLN